MLGPLWSNVGHVLFEALSYFVGVRLFLTARRRAEQDHDLHTRSDGLWVLVGAVCGAALGSKVLVWLQYPNRLTHALEAPEVLLAGKTIVGGILGGWLGVEVAKWRIGLRRSTGDLFVLPLIVGMMIGRLGCLLGGVYDDTYGVATALPWGLDLGDGVSRHPTALYEIVALALLAFLLLWLRRVSSNPVSSNAVSSSPVSLREGDLFRLFVAGYLAFRLGVDGLKPPHQLSGGVHTPILPDQPVAALHGGVLTAIQIACVIGLAYTAPAIVRAWRSSVVASRRGSKG